MIRIIHQIWFDLGNGKNIPEKYLDYQQSWKEKFSDWKYRLWNEKEGDELIKNYYSKYYKIYKNTKYPIMKIDILRYCILHKYGGMYVDIDYKCKINFENYINKIDKQIILVESQLQSEHDSENVYCSNFLLVSKIPNNSFWLNVLDFIIERIKNTFDIYHIYYVLNTTGPLMLTSFIKNRNDYGIFPSKYFSNANQFEAEAEAYHAYESYWNSKTWKVIRPVVMFCYYNKIIIIIVSIIIIALLCKYKYKANILKQN